MKRNQTKIKIKNGNVALRSNVNLIDNTSKHVAIALKAKLII